jgi:hypothetical protein
MNEPSVGPDVPQEVEVSVHRTSDVLLSIPLSMLNQEAVDEPREIQRWINCDTGTGKRSLCGQPLSIFIDRRKAAVITDPFDGVFELEVTSEQRMMIEHEPKQRRSRAFCPDNEERSLDHAFTSKQSHILTVLQPSTYPADRLT